MLKIHPTGIYKNTLGDGLAYAGNLNYADTNSDKEERLDDAWLPTPWNGIEVGMGDYGKSSNLAGDG